MIEIHSFRGEDPNTVYCEVRFIISNTGKSRTLYTTPSFKDGNEAMANANAFIDKGLAKMFGSARQ